MGADPIGRYQHASHDFYSISPSLRIDAQGVVHVAHEIPARELGRSGGIRVVTDASGAWIGQRVTRARDAYGPTLQLDEVGNAHIAYDRWNAGRSVYATNRSGPWTRTRLPVTEADAIHGAPDLFVSPRGRRIAVVDVDERGVLFAIRRHATWTVQRLSSDGGVLPLLARSDRQWLVVHSVDRGPDRGIYLTRER